MLANAKLYSYLSNRNIEESLNPLVVTDVVTSELYKELITEHGLGPNDISLTWNTDGTLIDVELGLGTPLHDPLTMADAS